jgi:hypothetical protein
VCYIYFTLTEVTCKLSIPNTVNPVLNGTWMYWKPVWWKTSRVPTIQTSNSCMKRNLPAMEQILGPWCSVISRFHHTNFKTWHPLTLCVLTFIIVNNFCNWVYMELVTFIVAPLFMFLAVFGLSNGNTCYSFQFMICPLIWYDMMRYDTIWYDIFNCSWVDTRWQ